MTYKIAVVGATGNVGRAILRILAERNFPYSEVVALASEKSVGKYVSFGNHDLEVRDLKTYDFRGTNIALFSAGSNISKEYAPKAANKGCIVIDNSSYFRTFDDIPLIVPEVNGDKISDYLERNIIANPNCAAIQMVTALKPLHDYANIEKIVVATYQSVSGAGLLAMDELYNQTKMRFSGSVGEPEILPRPIAFNVIPQIGDFLDNGFTGEEFKVIQETKRIMGADIKVEATCVRVPVFVGHSEAIYIECSRELAPEKAIELLTCADLITVIDYNHKKQDLAYITPIDCVALPMVYVSRIRQSLFSPKALNLWVVSDNLWKGAALNAVQIAEELVKSYL